MSSLMEKGSREEKAGARAMMTAPYTRDSLADSIPMEGDGDHRRFAFRPVPISHSSLLMSSLTYSSGWEELDT